MVKKFKTFGPQLVFAEQAAGSVVVTNEQKLSLYKKSQKSGISTDILEEVYRRGYSIWNESFGQTAEQFAFDRVNSFIAGGFAANLDSDLMTEEVKEPTGDLKDACWKGYTAVGMKMKNGRKVPNCVPVKEEALDETSSTNKVIKNVVAQKIGAAARQDNDPKHLSVMDTGMRTSVADKIRGREILQGKNRLKEDNEPVTPKALAKRIGDGPEEKLGGNVPDFNVGNFARGVASGVGLEPADPLDLADRRNASLDIIQRRAPASIKPEVKSAVDRIHRSDVGSRVGTEMFRDVAKHEDALETPEGQMGQVAGTLSQMGSVAAGAKLAGKGLSKTFSTIKKLIPQKSSEAKNLKTQEVNEMKMKSFKDTGKHFKTAETVEKQSKNPNDPDSRFDGTKSGKNVYQKATPGQPITEDNLKGDSMAALADRAKILDQLAQDRQNAIQAAQAPKTSTSQASERRQFGPEGEVVTTVGPRGEKTNALIPNMAAKKQPPKMVNALTQQKAPNTLSVVKNVVRESYVCDNCDCGLHEEILNERGADSKGYFRSTESGAGLTAKGAKHFGVQTAVTEPNPTGKRAARRRSFCARMSGMKGPMKDEKGRPTRKAMSLRRWNCH